MRFGLRLIRSFVGTRCTRLHGGLECRSEQRRRFFSVCRARAARRTLLTRMQQRESSMQGRDEDEPVATIGFPSIAPRAGSADSVEEFKEWVRRKIRPVFPHEMLVSGHGRLHAGGVALEYAVGVDFPASYLLGIRNRVGGIDSPILRRYLATREPQFFEADHPDLDVPAAWLRCFLEHDMRNVAAYGVYDAERCVGTYHAFYRIPGRLGRVHAELLKQLVPIMHEALDRVIELLHVRDGLGGLSPR